MPPVKIGPLDINIPDLVGCSCMTEKGLLVISYHVLEKSQVREQQKYNAGLRCSTV